MTHSYVSGRVDNLQRIELNGVKCLVRPETSDPFVAQEVIKQNTYRRLHIQPNDRVMDVGMNIGMFAVWAIQKGAARVWGYEPSSENYELAVLNLKLNECENKVETREMALTGTTDKVRFLSLNVHKNKGAHSLVEKRGRETERVMAGNFQDELKAIRPNCIKMDIEGGEWECIMDTTDFQGVRDIILEFHHAHLNDIPEQTKHHALVEHLGKHFPTVDWVRQPKKAWVTMVHAHQDSPYSNELGIIRRAQNG